VAHPKIKAVLYRERRTGSGARHDPWGLREECP